jgi:hypothetical protein
MNKYQSKPLPVSKSERWFLIASAIYFAIQIARLGVSLHIFYSLTH